MVVKPSPIAVPVAGVNSMVGTVLKVFPDPDRPSDMTRFDDRGRLIGRALRGLVVGSPSAAWECFGDIAVSSARALKLNRFLQPVPDPFPLVNLTTTRVGRADLGSILAAAISSATSQVEDPDGPIVPNAVSTGR